MVGVFIFEILLNICALFNHANLRLPVKLDHYLRLLIVTPDMHRVHHSTLIDETNSNFGFNLSCWDRFFKTYKAQPISGHDAMTIGLSEYQQEKNKAGGPKGGPNSILWVLTLPFRRQKD